MKFGFFFWGGGGGGGGVVIYFVFLLYSCFSPQLRIVFVHVSLLTRCVSCVEQFGEQLQEIPTCSCYLIRFILLHIQ